MHAGAELGPYAAVPRKTPIWAPGIGYVLTFGILGGVLILGPAAVAAWLGTAAADAPVAMRAGAVAVAVVLALIYVLALAAILRRRQIYRAGPAVLGQVTSSVEVRGKNGAKGRKVGFSFSVGGNVVSGTQVLDSLAVRAMGYIPVVGGRLVVVHDETKPTRSFILAGLGSAAR